MKNYELLKPFLEAAIDANKNSRRVVLILSTASILAFFGFWNSRQVFNKNWLDSRIERKEKKIQTLNYIKDLKSLYYKKIDPPANQPNSAAGGQNANPIQPIADTGQLNSNSNQQNSNISRPNSNADRQNANAGRPNSNIVQSNVNANQSNSNVVQSNANAGQQNVPPDKPDKMLCPWGFSDTKFQNDQFNANSKLQILEDDELCRLYINGKSGSFTLAALNLSKATDQSELSKIFQINDSHDSYLELLLETEKEDLAFLLRSKRENVTVLHVPFFYTSFDVNDLGLISGICFAVMFIWLRSSLWIELISLKRVFNRIPDDDNNYEDYYDYLSMHQLLVVPPISDGKLKIREFSKAGSKRITAFLMTIFNEMEKSAWIKSRLRKPWMIVAYAFITLPIITQLLIFYNDWMTYDIGSSNNGTNTFLITVFEILLIIFNVVFSTACTYLVFQLKEEWSEIVHKFSSKKEDPDLLDYGSDPAVASDEIEKNLPLSAEQNEINAPETGASGQPEAGEIDNPSGEKFAERAKRSPKSDKEK